jgi:hypothetical protein
MESGMRKRNKATTAENDRLAGARTSGSEAVLAAEQARLLRERAELQDRRADAAWDLFVNALQLMRCDRAKAELADVLEGFVDRLGEVWEDDSIEDAYGFALAYLRARLHWPIEVVPE